MYVGLKPMLHKRLVTQGEGEDLCNTMTMWMEFKRAELQGTPVTADNYSVIEHDLYFMGRYRGQWKELMNNWDKEIPLYVFRRENFLNLRDPEDTSHPSLKASGCFDITDQLAKVPHVLTYLLSRLRSD
jgi:hypothetical protein